MDILAVAGVLSAIALFLRAVRLLFLAICSLLREVRLLMSEIRRWRTPSPARKPRTKKEPSA